MSVSFDLPMNIEERIRAQGADPSSEAKEAYVIDLYRQERITHDELGDALGLGFHQTEQLLKDHCIAQEFSLEEFEAERGR
jgi:predicted HTH domain antitoxin